MAEGASKSGPNTLGNASLGLGIVAVSLVFGIGLCALVGLQQSWLRVAGTLLFVCGASSAFLGLLGVILGIGGLISGNRSRATSIAGLIFGMSGICLFLAVLSAVSQGA